MKRLLRKLGKALLFLLVVLIISLLVFALVDVMQTNQRIDQAEKQFTTIATVAQNQQPENELLDVEILNFNELKFVNQPENRPYYLARTSDFIDSGLHSRWPASSILVAEFKPMEMKTAETSPLKCLSRKSTTVKWTHIFLV